MATDMSGVGSGVRSFDAKYCRFCRRYSEEFRIRCPYCGDGQMEYVNLFDLMAKCPDCKHEMNRKSLWVSYCVECTTYWKFEADGSLAKSQEPFQR